MGSCVGSSRKKVFYNIRMPYAQYSQELEETMMKRRLEAREIEIQKAILAPILKLNSNKLYQKRKENLSSALVNTHNTESEV